MKFLLFLNDTTTTKIQTLHIVGSVRCVQETGYQRRVHGDMAHRDIKPDNLIIFNEDDEEHIQLKLADFDTILNPGEKLDIEDLIKHTTYSVSSRIGTEKFMSSELQNKCKNETKLKFNSKQEMLDFFLEK
eukprot:TRINITY_DN35396_c0_g1_i1.p1 TRINITY_DN35396_c0_g1~~TRINITY_DN35396_c0_g1_i1.p1  ORF type:complete len:131 (-),score=42.59 TRINITY_DN35396_c0_g1_i1:312-704(-)